MIGKCGTCKVPPTGELTEKESIMDIMDRLAQKLPEYEDALERSAKYYRRKQIKETLCGLLGFVFMLLIFAEIYLLLMVM